MKIPFFRPKQANSGSTFILALMFLSVTMLILAGALGWTTTSTTMTGRNIEYFRTEGAAEAATEKVLSHLAEDWRSQGEALVMENIDSYRQLVPVESENKAWKDYVFTDVRGTPGRTTVEYIPPLEYKVLTSQYRGLHGWMSTYRVISNARELTSRFNITGGLLQDLEVAIIPLFQFAIFYTLELEINPSPPMVITGPVHCNTNIYLDPVTSLLFQDDVRAVGQILETKKPGDPNVRANGTVTFAAAHNGGATSLNLPIGTNNDPVAVRQIMEIPPPGENPQSALGLERFYNKADLVALVSYSGVIVKSGPKYGTNVLMAPSDVSRIFTTNLTFCDKRENKTNRVTQVDMKFLRDYSKTNVIFRNLFPQNEIRSLYIADLRPASTRTQSVVRVVRGDWLPAKGFTLITPNPLYVQGNYNVTTTGTPVNLGTSNTSQTLPAALIGDAITVLSTNWNDANSGLAIGSRTAAPTTVNAAFLAGIVPTRPNSYSGGVENFPRFLENWSGKAFTYNGSMVVMFESVYAKSPWQGGDVYSPPIRNWSFDQNFRDEKKLPPETPTARSVNRGRWAMIKPGTGG